MLNDIFATSMGGHFQTTEDGAVIERGTWSYRGYGSAEIALHAEAELPRTGARYTLDIHSAETQLDTIALTALKGDGSKSLDLRVSIAGHEFDLSVDDGAEKREGHLSVPDETIYDGPSPIWLIHLLIVDPIPEDRTVVTPFVALGLSAEEIRSGFFRVSRAGLEITMEVLDNDGNPESTVQVTVADDGCPELVRSGNTVTEIVRVPQTLAS
jgi:hypothetical protein